MLPLLEDVLGGGVAEALARTATALREDTELIDALAARALPEARGRRRRTATLGALAALPDPVRRRVIRGWLLAGGAIGLTDKQIRGVDALVTALAWAGRGGGRVDAARSALVRRPPRRRADACAASRSDGPRWSLRSVGVARLVARAAHRGAVPGDIKSVLLTEEQIQARIAELGAQIGRGLPRRRRPRPARICC